MTDLTDQQRQALHDTHADVVAALRSAAAIRATITAIDASDPAVTTIDQATDRLHATREHLEKALGIAPITFDLDQVTYDVVPSTKYPSGFEVRCDGEFIAHIGAFGPDKPPTEDLIAVAKHAITNKPRRDFEL